MKVNTVTRLSTTPLASARPRSGPVSYTHLHRHAVLCLVGQLRQLAGGLFGLLFLQGLLTGFAQQREDVYKRQLQHLVIIVYGVDYQGI